MLRFSFSFFFFFFNDTATTEIYTLSLHDALPISPAKVIKAMSELGFRVTHLYGLTEVHGPSTLCVWQEAISEEHTSELQSQSNLVCRLLLEKKKKNKRTTNHLQDKQRLKCTHVGA